MSVLTVHDVTACLVTRGNVNLDLILETLPFAEVVVWDNSEREDLKCCGRYAAIAEATRPVIYFQDDDVIFRHHDELLAAYEPGMIVANWAHGENPDGYDDLPLVGAGALVDRGLPAVALDRYLEHWPRDDAFLYEADFIAGALTPFKHVLLPYQILTDIARHPSRLCNQPWQQALKLKITNRARQLRDMQVAA